MPEVTSSSSSREGEPMLAIRSYRGYVWVGLNICMNMYEYVCMYVCMCVYVYVSFVYIVRMEGVGVTGSVKGLC